MKDTLIDAALFVLLAVVAVLVVVFVGPPLAVYRFWKGRNARV